VNRWWMCDEGRIGFHQLNESETRLAEPLARVEGKLRSAQWDAIYGATAQRAKEIGAGGSAVLGLADTFATNEELYVFQKLVCDALGGETAYFPLRPGRQQQTPPRADVDPFIHTLITTDKSPNTAGALALGLTGDEDDRRLRAAIKAGPKVVVILGNPLAGDAAVRKALRKAELIVSIATFAGGWSEIADVVLPGRTYAEKQGSYTNKANRVQAIHPAIKPPEESRDQVEILQQLMAALGKAPEGLGSPSAVFDAIGQEVGLFKGLTWDALGALGAVAGEKG
ncbi:MAG: molybdopterin-dependent oxidoreductase, partial [bacterium]